VAQAVDGDALGQPSGLARRAAGGLEHRLVDRAVLVAPQEQPVARLGQAPVGVQDGEQLSRRMT
jgi:hypothetical protein